MVKYSVFSFWLQGTGKSFDRLSNSQKSRSGKLCCWTKTESFLSLKLLGNELQAHCFNLWFFCRFPVVIVPRYGNQTVDSNYQESFDYQAMTRRNLPKPNWRRRKSWLTNKRRLLFVPRKYVEPKLLFFELIGNRLKWPTKGEFSSFYGWKFWESFVFCDHNKTVKNKPLRFSTNRLVIQFSKWCTKVWSIF